MTTDPFAEAAEAASWANDRQHDELGEWSRMKFMRGAEWARTHLAQQEPTDVEVRAAAIECVKFLFLTAPERPWEDPEVVEQWEPMARIALRSARTARRDEEK